jgi:hypothetical protein
MSQIYQPLLLVPALCTGDWSEVDLHTLPQRLEIIVGLIEAVLRSQEICGENERSGQPLYLAKVPGMNHFPKRANCLMPYT